MPQKRANMKAQHRWAFVIAAAALMTVACGGESPLAPTSVPNGGNTHDSGTLSASQAVRFGVLNSDPCGDVTYVGPIRLPISVHGTTADISWLGADGATRGYELEFERYDVTNVWVFAMHDVVKPPEASEHFKTGGTYRVRVRGLFCNDQVGGWTDWVVFSTDDNEDHSPVPPPVFCPSSVNGCYPPPPPVCQPNEHLVDGECVHNGDGDGEGDGQGDENGGGGGGGNPGPSQDPPGNPGGDNSCHLTTTSKPATPPGGGNGNPPQDGDDHDCGGGNDEHGPQ